MWHVFYVIVTIINSLINCNHYDPIPIIQCEFYLKITARIHNLLTSPIGKNKNPNKISHLSQLINKMSDLSQLILKCILHVLRNDK